MPSLTSLGLEQQLVVGIADLAVSNNPGVVLCTHSLGSCIGVSIYDPEVHVGGLLHVMLPESSIEPARAMRQPALFMDTGLAALFHAAAKLGAVEQRLVICAAGGCQLMDTSGMFSIGRKNHEALLRFLTQHDLQLYAEQIGGLVSRSMFLRLETGDLRLKISGQTGEVTLCKSSTITSIKSKNSPPPLVSSPSC